MLATSTTAGWTAVVVAIAAVLAGLVSLGIIWRKFLHPVIKTVVVISEAAPTLLEVAAEFKPNGGGSLHDVVGRIETTLIETHATQGAQVERFMALTADVHEHVEADKVAFERIDEALHRHLAQEERAEAKVEAVAAALKVETEAIAADLKTTTADLAADLKAHRPPNGT